MRLLFTFVSGPNLLSEKYTYTYPYFSMCCVSFVTRYNFYRSRTFLVSIVVVCLFIQPCPKRGGEDLNDDLTTTSRPKSEPLSLLIESFLKYYVCSFEC